MASRPNDPDEVSHVEGGAEVATDGIVTEGMRTRRLPGDGGIAADAGEYVLGTLEDAELDDFTREVKADPEARRLVTFWRDRLGLLDEVAAPVAPSAGVWDAIAAALPEGAVLAANDDELHGLRRSRNLWRGAAVAAALLLVGGALAAASPELRGAAERRLGLTPAERPVIAGAEGEVYLAVVNAEGKLPAMIVRVDAATGRVSVRPIALPRPEGRSLEMWHIARGSSDPVSVGLLDDGAAVADVAAGPGDTFAVTEEAVGGSADGTPTGPIILSGQLVREPR